MRGCLSKPLAQSRAKEAQTGKLQVHYNPYTPPWDEGGGALSIAVAELCLLECMRERNTLQSVMETAPISFPFSFPSKGEILAKTLLQLEEGKWRAVWPPSSQLLNSLWLFSKRGATCRRIGRHWQDRSSWIIAQILSF